MVLNKILKPIIKPFSKEKWQNKNPEIRKKAIAEIPVSDQDTLYNLATADSDDSVKTTAVSRLHDLDMLQTIIMKGTNGQVKQAAQERLFQLLAGEKHPVPEYDIREKMIRGSRNSALLEYVATNADKAELRELTIKRISRDPLLGDIALNDHSAQVRQLAAQQIAKRSTLERVAKNSRRKDKRVYKIVKTKLDRIIEDEARPALFAKEVVDICEKLEKLFKRNRLLQEKSTFENFVTRWSEIQNFANEETTQRYHSICEQIIAKMDNLELVQKQQQDSVHKLDCFLSSLSQVIDELLILREQENADPKLIEEKDKVVLALGQEWDEEIKFIADPQIINQYNGKFQAILDLANTQNDLLESSPAIDKIENLVDQAESILEKEGYIPEKTISVLSSHFSQQIKNSLSPEAENLQHRFADAIQQVKAKIVAQHEKAHALATTIKRKITQTKQLISDGHVSQADKQLRNLFKEIDHSPFLSTHQKQEYHNQFKVIQSELGNLSSWRNWAHDNERENLALKAERLAEKANNQTDLGKAYNDITTEVKELRKQWKKLRSPTQEELWERFNHACNEAYDICMPFIEQEHQQRKNNLDAKNALCEQLETYIQSMHWPTDAEAAADHTVDWIKVDKIIRQARKEWSEIGFVERKEHKRIHQRFEINVDIIRAELKKAWHENQNEFYDLIHKVQALAATVDDDLPGAINKAKDYQKQWKQVGPVSSFQRNKLWKKFRKACDIIFDKRQENIEKKNSENSERLREKEAICENLEALNQQPLQRHDLEKAYQDILTLWNTHEFEIKNLSKEVNHRFKEANRVYQNKLNNLIAQEQDEQLELIKQKAELCTHLESASNDSEDVLEQLKADWSELAKLPHELEAQFQQRFDKALNTLSSSADSEQRREALIQAELEEKNTFCLKHEILSGKHSPEQFHHERMALQVELLNSNLGHHNTEEHIEHALNDFELQVQWHLMSNYSQDSELENRFQQLIA
jgi:hypothetical protein